MAKFVLVKEAPELLRKEEYVINPPTFIEEIRENAAKAPRNGLTGIHQLRTIVGTIGQKYDPELTAWNIRPHLYEGRPFANENELSAIILDMLRTQYPKIFDRYLDYKIKHRPVGTKLIYFMGSFSDTTAFSQNGIDLLDEKDIETYLGLKPKKTVGRPALTKEQAEENKTE